MTTAFVDYFTGIFHNFSPTKLNYPDTGLPNLWEFEKGQSGYDRVQRHSSTGLIRGFNSLRRDMGLMYRASGDCLKKLTDMTGLPVSKTLPLFGLANLKCTRIDLTIDILMPIGELGRLAKDAGKMNQRRERNKYTVIGEAGTSKGMTIYRGKRTSEIFIRFYDSSLMHGLPEGTIRMELEIKGKRANIAWNTLRSSDTPSAWIQGILSGVNEFESLANHLGAIEELERIEPSDSESDTWAWLEKQVIPTLKRDLISFSSERLLQRLVAASLQGFGEFPDGIVEALDTLISRYLSELRFDE